MPIISIIAATDEGNGLGKNNELLVYLPADLVHFKTHTIGKPIIMGRKTYDSIGKPLPGRKNIIISRQLKPIPEITVVPSLDAALMLCEDMPEIMIIGGAQIYTQALVIADRLYLTKIHHQFAADVFFPEIDEKLWSCHHSEFRPKDEKNPYDMTFLTYQRV